jgi:AraC-like DNA-binding protein
MPMENPYPRDQAIPLPRDIRRALDVMRAQPGRAWSLPNLAAIAGVSPRTLQRHFVIFVGKTPLAALCDLRFERARRELLRGSPRTMIAGVAHRCGFAHLGRFSIEYCRRYREKPSQTLRRRAAFATAQLPIRYVASGYERPTIAITPIVAREAEVPLARDVAEELAMALMRAGMAVTDKPGAARYHLRGTLRRDEQQGHLTFRLVEVATGRHICAYRHDSESDEDLADESLATTIAAAMQPALRAAEIERARHKPDTELTAQDLTLKALPYALALDMEGNKRALNLLERAMEADSNYAMAVALSAWCYGQRIVYHFTNDTAQDRARSLNLAHRAVGMGGDATVLAVLGNAFGVMREFELASRVTEKALALDGSSYWAWSRSGMLDICNGRLESGAERLHIALDLCPDDPLAFNSMIGIGAAHFQAGRYAEAVRWYERAIGEHHSAVWANYCLCPAYVLCSRRPEALRSLAALLQLYPELTISRVTAGIPFGQTFRNRVANGLESVGMRP